MRRPSLLAGLIPHAVMMLAALSFGCASIEAVPVYTPPSSGATNHVAVVDRDFDDAWARIVRGLAQSVFDVQQVSKDSGLITIDLARDGLDDTNAGRLERLIDCGTLEISVNGAPWRFEPKKSSKFRRRSTLGLAEIDHLVSGRVGRLSILLEPEGDRTRVEANARFELRMQQSGAVHATDFLGRPQDTASWGTHDASFRLTTRLPDRQLLRGVPIECASTQAWEREIVDLAR
ncbi:MAG: hypothetical protein NXI30_04195 [bacterium]|nr:hypothetical protein [bacterium]